MLNARKSTDVDSRQQPGKLSGERIHGNAAYVQMHRLNVAARHLLTDAAPVSQIAYRVGFASAAHFSTAFAERFGLSPRAFRLRATGQSDPPQNGESD